jgi:hypothetical protein
MLTLSQNKSRRDSTWLTSPQSSIGCLLYYFWAYGTFDANRAPILQNRASTWALSPGVPLTASKMISMPIVCFVKTMHLSCTDTVSKWAKTRFRTTPITYKFHRVRPKLFTSQWYVQCKPCTYLASWLTLSLNRPTRAPPDPRHLGVPSGASNTIYEPMVRSVQTVHLSCVKISTISKWTEQSSSRPSSLKRTIGCV